MTQGGTYLPVLIGVLALALVIMAAATLRGGSSNRVRERVRETIGIDAQSSIAVGPSIRIMAREERGRFQRFAEALGYNPELPPAYAASVPAVVLVASAAGLLCFWRAHLAFGDVLGVAAGALAAAASVRFMLRRKTRLYTQELFRQIPDAISLVLRAVRAGLPVTEAVRSISREMPSPSRDEFARVAGEASLGVPLETALWSLYMRTRIREYSFFAVTLGLNGQTGGNLAETLENLADMVRKRVAMTAKARALSSEGRASAMILGGLPFVVGGILTLINPKYVSLLFTDPRGDSFLVAFVVLLSLGLLTIRTLIQRSTQD